MDTQNKIVVFESKQVRRVWHGEEWWYVLEDVVAVLTESNDTKQYIRRMRSRDPELSKGWVQIVLTLKIETSGGSQRMNCAKNFKAQIEAAKGKQIDK